MANEASPELRELTSLFVGVRRGTLGAGSDLAFAPTLLRTILTLPYPSSNVLLHCAHSSSPHPDFESIPRARTDLIPCPPPLPWCAMTRSQGMSNVAFLSPPMLHRMGVFVDLGVLSLSSSAGGGSAMDVLHERRPSNFILCAFTIRNGVAVGLWTDVPLLPPPGRSRANFRRIGESVSRLSELFGRHVRNKDSATNESVEGPELGSSFEETAASIGETLMISEEMGSASLPTSF